jgi:hypothetical protein
VHLDNYSVHGIVTTESFMKTQNIISMPHPPYSPDLEPSDVYLSPAAKEKLEHSSITDED